ncbi:hypothetical protein L1987_07712 [Smallanthus sonchifolius]|uniref:Uncharacterized protein n=1 Tax=Smallanthus sonchifolius TaxID=185202 RepID=A0ACB9K0V1_9ASTR|nr:hypothetical protein L1987_07712 [Smallanthus sonchifolius]
MNPFGSSFFLLPSSYAILLFCLNKWVPQNANVLQFYQILRLVQVLSLLIALPKAHYGILEVWAIGHNAKVKLQLQNCSQTWILHWGCISNGNKKWFVPSFYPSGTTVYKKAALCTPFIKVEDEWSALNCTKK